MTYMKQIIYAISLIFLLGACTDEKYGDTFSPEVHEPGEPVPVELVLNTQPVQSPLSSGTKAGGDVVSSTQVCKGMEISLVGTPVTRATVESEIKNFQIFQFSGTELTSTLIRKQFINGNSVKEVLLSPSVPGKKDRIIIIANAGNNTFGLQEGTSTLNDLKDKAIGYNEANKAFPSHFPLLDIGTDGTIPFSGSADVIVVANKQVDIMLYRTVARAKVNISLSSEMQGKGYTTWTYQFMSIPKKSFYSPESGHLPAFPGESVGYADYIQKTILFSSPIDVYLPVNLHQPVPFTTPERRVINAPAGATYLQLMGLKMNGNVINRSVIYQIHLGSNFTDDYSISSNYSYTYNIRLTGENDDDSRVIKFIPGYFGGALKMYDSNGNVTSNPSKVLTWRYDKKIEVYITDVNDPGGIKWLASGTMPDLNSLMDGRQNSWDLRNQTSYSALQRCIALNGTPAPSTISDMEWYMPSYGQSLGIYVAGSSTLRTLPNTYYWSSTANTSFAWGTQVWTGASTMQNGGSLYNLRCVKDLIPGNLVAE